MLCKSVRLPNDMGLNAPPGWKPHQQAFCRLAPLRGLWIGRRGIACLQKLMDTGSPAAASSRLSPSPCQGEGRDGGRSAGHPVRPACAPMRQGRASAAASIPTSGNRCRRLCATSKRAEIACMRRASAPGRRTSAPPRSSRVAETPPDRQGSGSSIGGAPTVIGRARENRTATFGHDRSFTRNVKQPFQGLLPS